MWTKFRFQASTKAIPKLVLPLYLNKLSSGSTITFHSQNSKGFEINPILDYFLTFPVAYYNVCIAMRTHWLTITDSGLSPFPPHFVEVS